MKRIWIGTLGCATILLVVSAAFFAFNIVPQFSSGETRSAPQVTLQHPALTSYVRLTQLKLSPDGLAEVALGIPLGRGNPRFLKPRLLLGSMDGGTFESLEGTEGALEYAFSPSGRRVLYSAADPESGATPHLFTITVRGEGRPVHIRRWDEHWNAFPIWLDEAELAVTTLGGSRIDFIRTDGGKSRAACPIQGTSEMRNIRLVSRFDGNSVWVASDRFRRGAVQFDIGLLDLRTGRANVLVPDGGNPRLVSGRLVFSRGGTLYGANFDPSSKRMTGHPVPILSGIRTSERTSNAAFDLTDRGVLQFLSSQLEWRDRGPILQSPTPWNRSDFKAWSEDRKAFEGTIEAAPDGLHFASLIANSGGELQAWICQREVPWARLAVAVPGFDVTGVTWSPDSRDLAYGIVSDSRPGGVYVMHADGTGAPQRVFGVRQGLAVTPTSWSRDGMLLCFSSQPKGPDLLVASVSRPGAPTRPFQDSSARSRGVISPDGMWIAYEEGLPGSTAIAISGWNGSNGIAGPRLVAARGDRPRWTRDGKGVLFCGPDRKLLRVDVVFDGRSPLGEPSVLCDLGEMEITGSLYDVLPDGNILAIRSGWEERSVLGFSVAPRFVEELNARMSYLEGSD